MPPKAGPQQHEIIKTLSKSSRKNGKITLGLVKIGAPFHFEMHFNGDLTQIPPILGRVVKHKGFLNELALFKELKGSATGFLKLGEDLRKLTARVESSKVHAMARYERVPYPIKIDGRQFVYEGRRITLQNFNANIGKSSFLNPSFAVDWSGTPKLNLNSQSAKFNLDELYTWLLSFDAFKKNLNNIHLNMLFLEVIETSKIATKPEYNNCTGTIYDR